LNWGGKRSEIDIDASNDEVDSREAHKRLPNLRAVLNIWRGNERSADSLLFTMYLIFPRCISRYHLVGTKVTVGLP